MPTDAVAPAWIETVSKEEAEGDLRELYERVSDPESGALDNIMRVHSLHPRGLRAHYELYRAAMRGTRGLRAVDRELIALAVSELNACHY